MSTQSFFKIIKNQIEATPDKEAYLFANEAILNTLDQRLDVAHKGYTYAEMDEKFKAVAATLQTILEPGAHVLILHEPGEHFVTAFMGCLYAGLIAVPIYPPNPARLERTLPHFLAVIQDAAPSAVLTNALFKEAATDFMTTMPGMEDIPIILSSTIDKSTAAAYQAYEPSAEEVAFLQYTSGSTGKPSGVMLTHGNLSDNLNNICITHQYEQGVRIVSWLPPYHDLGLIAGILVPMYAGGSGFIMSPMDFLSEPNRWMQAMHWYKGEGTGGPNFGYEIMVKKFKPETFEQLDLSTWRIAVNGAEPIKKSTLDKFIACFEPYGFKPSTFCLSYGMSEATNMVSGGVNGDITPRYIQRSALEKNKKIIELPIPTPETRTVLSCGRIAPGFDVRIVNPITLKECQLDYAGEIWLKSASIGKGYWNDPKKTAATFDATLIETQESGFLRTGDYGFVRDNQIFITGRLKDLIIVRGRNYHPEDIETTVMNAHANFAQGACAAFSVNNEQGEHLVVVQELIEHNLDFSAEYIREMFQKASIAVTETHGIQLSELVLIPRRTIHKTGSGKISRSNTQKAWEDKTLDILHTNKVSEFILKDLPKTATEKQLAKIWEELLKVDSIERSSDFMDHGGDSMAVVELSSAIKEEFDFLVTPDVIYRNSILSAMARVIEQQQVEVLELDLEKEITLELDATAIQNLPKAANNHKVVLLTGATGFLGRYLLENLINRPQVETVVVLLRNKDLEKDIARIHKAFDKHQLSKAHFDKIEFCYGDLARPRLGLSQAAFKDLGAYVDTIYHCGAQVDWVKPYNLLRATNVDGTREVIKLAATKTLKPLHHISTMWVLNSQAGSHLSNKMYSEDHRSDWRGLENGYAQSKWVAENLIFKAADIGIPTTSHRMDFIVGSKKTGIIPERDFFARIVQDVMKMGLICKETIHLDVIAVDYLANSIVSLAEEEHAPGTVFHYEGSKQLSTDEMTELLSANGYPVQKVAYRDWVEAITAHPKNQSWPLKYFLWAYASSPVLTIPDYNDTNKVTYEHTNRALAKVGLSSERDNVSVADVFVKLVQYLEGKTVLQSQGVL